jgi:hypothetical protein
MFHQWWITSGTIHPPMVVEPQIEDGHANQYEPR